MRQLTKAGCAKVGGMMAVMEDILTHEQQAWLSDRVRTGEFPSVEEAARQLIDESITMRAMIEADDLAWAKPLVDVAIAEIERGEFLTREQYRSRLLEMSPLKD